MKIKKVKWKSHPILGDLELDFMNYQTNELYQNIIFVGENGMGKTTILESISTFLNIGTFEFFDFLTYEIENKTYQAVQTERETSIKDFFDIINSNGERTEIHTNRNNSPKKIQENNVDPRKYGCVFSKARSDYRTQKINATTTKELDTDKYDTDSENDFTSLKQLIIDVQNQDNDEYAEINRQRRSNPLSWKDFYKTSRIFRFKDSFDKFFENMEYNKVQNKNGEKVILFKKNDKDIEIDNLSTGEKQIVFRGIYLLRNLINLSSSIIMVDEPELSMHPKWQKKILNYYQNIFNVPEEENRPQLFFASHSTFVIENATRDYNNNLIIVLNNKNGQITARRMDRPTLLPSVTNAQINYLAYGIYTNDFHIELYGYLQNKNHLTTVKGTDTFIKGENEYDPTIHQKVSSYGRTNYDTLCTYIRNTIDHPDNSRYFSYDELKYSTELLIKLCNKPSH